MKYNCKEIQNLILESKADATNKHIKTCPKCVQFLNAHHDLAQHYDISDITCPDSVNFEKIYAESTSNVPTKTITVFNFSKIATIAACLMISLLFLPRNIQRPTSSDYLNEINQAIIDLNTSIDTMELDLTDNQELFSVSVNNIEDSLNFLQKEI